MRVISVDLGWRHLAYADMEVGLSSMNLIKWEILDVINDENINVNDATTEVLIEKSAKILENIVEMWSTSNPECVFLESQPLGQMARNVKTKTLSHVLQALLLAKNMRVQFVSPKLKLKLMAKEGSYNDNKKFAVKATIELLESNGLTEEKEKFETRGGKRDDLADALLQGYYATKQLLKPQKEKKQRSKRPKRDSHAVAEASVSDELFETFLKP